MRILWLSNARWSVGLRRADRSLHTHVSATWGTRWPSLPTSVSRARRRSGTTCRCSTPRLHNATVSTFARHWKADWVISSVRRVGVQGRQSWDDDLKMAMWAPVDEWPPPIAVIETLKHEKVRPIAMSRFGEHWLQKSGLDPLYVPHGVDTAVFRPTRSAEPADREVLEMPEDAFVVGMVGANRGWSKHACRKAFPQAFDAFSQFAARHDDAYLYCHTQAQPKRHPGIDLVLMSRAMGIPEDRLAFPPDVAWHLNVMDNRFVAGVMNAFDVLLNPSMSEGFGIPIIEAQACGVPVIVCDHSSMPELVPVGLAGEWGPLVGRSADGVRRSCRRSTRSWSGWRRRTRTGGTRRSEDDAVRVRADLRR